MAGDNQFAVLIDAENISSKYVKYIFAELAGDGVATYKRIYGDWTAPNMNSWKSVLLDNSLIPIQQFSYTNGKNATDSAMIIDAMDILYGHNVQGFCLVSSDSDFTRLASRLREAGMVVIGMGEQKTPAPFKNACNKFRYLEVLEQASKSSSGSKNEPKPALRDSEQKITNIKNAVTSIINDNSDEEGKVSLSYVGNALANMFPDFDVRNFGHNKLSKFILSLGFDQRSGPNENNIFIGLPVKKSTKKQGNAQSKSAKKK